MGDSARGRLQAMFAAARAEGRAVLLPYLTAGIPDPDASVSLFSAMAEAGADGFEVGIPYADPLMDGPVVMAAGELALARGVTVDVAFEVVARVVDTTRKPVLVMTYVNPVLRHGIGGFFDKVVASGASGVILADLPADESGPFVDAARSRGVGMVQFVAPTTGPERLSLVAESDPVFVYAVAEVGVTGERARPSQNIEALAAAIRTVSDVPIVFGVGISTPDQAASAARFGDGVIVGSAIVRTVLEASDVASAEDDLRTLVEGLARAVRAR